jgi:RNA polymerase sigma-70 factor (ECF subfamily)
LPASVAGKHPANKFPVAGPTDEELVRTARDGDRLALAMLLQRHRLLLVRQLQRFPLDDESRRDLLQEAMLQVVRKLHTFRGDAQFGTWLYRIAANAALMRMRSEQRRRSAPIDDEMPATLGNVSEWTERADHKMEGRQRAARLDEALSALPPSYRDIVIDHYIDGQTLQGVAHRLGTTESAVRSRLHRARASLRRMLSDLAA